MRKDFLVETRAVFGEPETSRN